MFPSCTCTSFNHFNLKLYNLESRDKILVITIKTSSSSYHKNETKETWRKNERQDNRRDWNDNVGSFVSYRGGGTRLLVVTRNSRKYVK